MTIRRSLNMWAFSVTVTVDRNGQCRYTDMELALAAPAPVSA